MLNSVLPLFFVFLLFLAGGCGLTGGLFQGDPLAAQSGFLVGSGADEVLDSLGVPECIFYSNEKSVWGYCDEKGHLHKDAVLFHSNCVVGIDTSIERFAEPKPIPPGVPYLGQRVDEMVECVGAITDYSTGSLDLVLDYTDMRVILNGGRIVGLERRVR